MASMLVLGDSHVRRLGHFMFNLPDQFRSRVHRGWADDVSVSLHGVGGRRVRDIVEFDLDLVRDLSPQVVILCVGGNDLCAPGACPLATASALHDAARACTDSLGVARVYVCTIPSRSSYPATLPPYPDRVRDCNHYLQEILSVEGRVCFWKLFGLYCEDPTVHAQDGVHFNARGNYKLYRAIRGAVLQGLAAVSAADTP